MATCGPRSAVSSGWSSATLSPGEPLRARFDAMEARADDDGGPPPLAAVRAARDAFYAVPVEEQRHILNGWKPDPNRLTRRQVAEISVGCGVRHVLRLLPNGGDGTLFAGHENAVCESTHAVAVEIQEGATRDEVVSALAACLRLVADRWPELMEVEWKIYRDGPAGEGKAARRQPGECGHG